MSQICQVLPSSGRSLKSAPSPTKNLLGLSNNYWALIIPMLVNPFNLIIMRSFFKSSIPDAIIEAAAIDGSGEYNTLFKIVLPISMPGIATVSLLTQTNFSCPS